MGADAFESTLAEYRAAGRIADRDSPQAREHSARLLLRLVDLVRSDSLELAEQYAADLEAAAKLHADEPALLLAHAKCQRYLLQTRDFRDLDKGLRVLDDLEAMARDGSASPKVAAERAWAAQLVLVRALESGRADDAGTVEAHMTRMPASGTGPGAPEMRLRIAAARCLHCLNRSGGNAVLGLHLPYLDAEARHAERSEVPGWMFDTVRFLSVAEIDGGDSTVMNWMLEDMRMTMGGTSRQEVDAHKLERAGVTMPSDADIAETMDILEAVAEEAWTCEDTVVEQAQESLAALVAIALARFDVASARRAFELAGRPEFGAGGEARPRLAYAFAASSLVEALAREDRQRALGLFRELEATTGRHPGVPSIREPFVAAGLALMETLEEDDNISAIDLHRRIFPATRTVDPETDLPDRHAALALELLGRLHEGPLVTETREVARDLLALKEYLPDTPAVRKFLDLIESRFGRRSPISRLWRALRPGRAG